MNMVLVNIWIKHDHFEHFDSWRLYDGSTDSREFPKEELTWLEWSTEPNPGYIHVSMDISTYGAFKEDLQAAKNS